MNRTTLPLTALASMMLLPAASFAAEDLSYTYVQLDYIVEDIDLEEDNDALNNVVEDFDDGDGFKLTGSYAFTDTFFVFGKYSNTTADYDYTSDAGLDLPPDTDIKTLNLGLGYVAPLTYRMDFVSRVSYIDVDYGDFSVGEQDSNIDQEPITDVVEDSFEDSTDGFAIDAGVRSQVVDWLEAAGGLRFTKLDTGNDFSFFGNVLFEINPNMGISVGVETGDMASSYNLGFRWSM